MSPSQERPPLRKKNFRTRGNRGQVLKTMEKERTNKQREVMEDDKITQTHLKKRFELETPKQPEIRL